MNQQFCFDTIADRSLDHARKWDATIIQQKFPHAQHDAIPMWIADMDFSTAPAICNRLAEIARNGAYGYGYAHNGFYDAVISWQKRRHNNDVQRDWITLAYGTVPTIHYLYQAFCQPHDTIVLQTPVYDPFGYAARNNGFQILSCPLIYQDNTYYIDYELLNDYMERYHPRIHLFCSPHNPGGRIWTRDELIRVAEICYRHDCILVVDEVHCEHIIQGTFVSALQLPNQFLDNLIVLTSPNKGFNLGGLKTSYSMIPNRHLRDAFRHRLEMNSITSPNTFGCAALIAAYNESEEWLDAVCAYMRESYYHTAQFIHEHLNGWELMDMQASYLPWVNIAATGLNATQMTNHMAQNAGVLLGDGTYYVANGDQFVRLNLGMPHALVNEALERLAAHQDYAAPHTLSKA